MKESVKGRGMDKECGGIRGGEMVQERGEEEEEEEMASKPLQWHTRCKHLVQSATHADTSSLHQ